MTYITNKEDPWSIPDRKSMANLYDDQRSHDGLDFGECSK